MFLHDRLSVTTLYDGRLLPYGGRCRFVIFQSALSDHAK